MAATTLDREIALLRVAVRRLPPQIRAETIRGLAELLRNLRAHLATAGRNRRPIDRSRRTVGPHNGRSTRMRRHR